MIGTLIGSLTRHVPLCLIKHWQIGQTVSDLIECRSLCRNITGVIMEMVLRELVRSNYTLSYLSVLFPETSTQHLN